MSESPMWNPLSGGGFIFDWDGVLARTNLDFSPVRNKYFQGRRASILEEMALQDPDVREAIAREVNSIEMAGAAKAQAVEGASGLIALLDEKSIPWSVVSRNSPESIDLAARTIGFKLPKNTFNRESGPIKPSPEALWMAADAMGVPRQSCTVVGDFVYDVLGARRAGMRAVLVERDMPEWAKWSDLAFPTMADFLSSLKENSSFVPWEYRGVFEKHGLPWLMAAWKITVQVPGPLNYPDLELLFKLASLGVGRFKAPEGPLPYEAWESVVCLGPELLDRTQSAVLEKIMAPRYPLVEVAETGAAVPLEDFRDNPEKTLGRYIS